MEHDLPSTGEPIDIHTWLVQKLNDERRAVLLHLEEKHRELLEQFLARTKTDVPTSALAVPSEIQMMPVVERHKEDEELADMLPSNVVEQPDEHTLEVKEQQEQNDKSQEQNENTKALDSDGRNQIMPPKFEGTAKGNAFECFFGVVILANAFVIALTQQHRGLQLAQDRYDSHAKDKEDVWPGANTAWLVLEWAFAILFTVEFVARLVILRRQFLRDGWCYFDGCILAFAWMTIFQVEQVNFNPTFARMARVAKMLRLVHLLRSNSMVDVLKLMLMAIDASFATLVWSATILWTVIFISALLMVQLLESYLGESSAGDPKKFEEQKQVFIYFGTFYRALLTMFEVTFANWVPPCRILVENVGQLYAMFFFFYRCLIGLAVIMVVQAVFIQQTMKAARLDDESLAKQKAKERASILRRVEGLFRHLDLNKDGFLEEAEFARALEAEDMKALLEVFDLEVWHIDELVNIIMDNGRKTLSVDEFVSNVQHLRGTARSIDVIATRREVGKIKHFLMHQAQQRRQQQPDETTKTSTTRRRPQPGTTQELSSI